MILFYARRHQDRREKQHRCLAPWQSNAHSQNSQIRLIIKLGKSTTRTQSINTPIHHNTHNLSHLEQQSIKKKGEAWNYPRKAPNAKKGSKSRPAPRCSPRSSPAVRKFSKHTTENSTSEHQYSTSTEALKKKNLRQLPKLYTSILKMNNHHKLYTLRHLLKPITF